MTRLCIMVAPNGARRSRTDHPNLPITAGELAQTARSCRAAGAAAIHLHVRDAEGRHTLDAGAYRSAVAAISGLCPDIVIQTTTEAAGMFDIDQQISAVEALRPACLSFALAELMQGGDAKGEQFLHWAAAQRMAIQFILYDADQIADFARRWRAGRLHLSGMPRLIVVAGRYAPDQNSDPAAFDALHLALRRHGLDSETVWMTCAFGLGEMACLERTIALGGHARVGFENAALGTDNAERVAEVAKLARKHGRALANAAEAAAILGRQGDSHLLRP